MAASYVTRMGRDSGRRSIDVEIGPTLTYNDYVSREAEYASELRIGFLAAWKVFGEARITEDLQIFPSLTDTGEFRLISENCAATSDTPAGSPRRSRLSAACTPPPAGRTRRGRR